MGGILSGVTVVALEHVIAAPFATRHLADLGARVIKIERPGGGDFARGYDKRARGLASHFVWTNRGKQSIALDLKAPEGLEVLDRLVRRADVVIQNLAPGAAARLGASYEALAAKNPAIILCEISGYGEDGPYSDKKAYDLLVQSEAGLLSVTGTPDDVVKAGISIADIAAGMYAYSSILAALYDRARTGRGRRIEISMLEALAEWMGFPLYYTYDGEAPPPRSGASHATIYPYGPFRCGDGRTIMMGLQNEPEWAAFCDKVLGRPELKADPRFQSPVLRATNRAALQPVIDEAFGKLTAAAVVERLDAAGIGNATVNEMHDVWAHPQLAARDRWREMASPEGPLPTLRLPGSWTDEEAPVGAVPAVGEHTDLVLADLGYSRDEIAGLRARGAI
jgi:crotonobetainyl-CoA:carnitine CoA-transferase CaiB-like acyl-CoA transferase